MAIAFRASVDYFIHSVFNYPTLAECYKVAALNGSNKLRHLWQCSETSAERNENEVPRPTAQSHPLGEIRV